MTPSGSFQGWKREICVTSGRLSWMPIQSSTREGFGLVVSESLWKGTPVVAGRAGGIPLQMADGAGGSLVTSVDEWAAAIVALLRDPARAEELGWRGRRRVREHFLLPRLLLNELRLMESLVAEPPRVGLEEWREPVCGLAFGREQRTLGARLDGQTVHFCSRECRARFPATTVARATARGA